MFDGFRPETFDFLWGIRMNNERDWFLAHKNEYLTYLYEPMKALAQELFVPFAGRSGDLLKVSRIYRDARLHYPVPYKESLWICIRRDVEWWAENPCLYFEIRPEGVSYGFVLWKPRAASMDAFRREITARPEPFLALMERTRRQTGAAVTADCLKRPKLPADSRLAPYFAWKGNICCVREEAPGEALFTGAIAERARTMLSQLMELYDFFSRFQP